METASVLSRRWLRRSGVQGRAQDVIVADVADRLSDLPSVLKAAATIADRTLRVMPAALREAILRLPGGSEYERMVVSLTAVAYFDAVSRTGAIPDQRRAEERVDVGA